MKVYLETTRFYLREFTKEDEQILLELDSDPEVMLWLTNGEVGDLEKIQTMMTRVDFLLNKYDHKFGVWAAIEKNTNEFLGWFHLRPCKKNPDDLKNLELGYRFFKNHWGKGFATEGSVALINKAFIDFGANEVFATAMKKNTGSIRVLEKAGLEFQYEYYDERFPVKEEVALYYSIKKNNSKYG